MDAKVSKLHRIITADAGSRLARLGRAALRNPLHVLLRYGLPIGVGGGLAAVIGLVLMDDSGPYPDQRRQDVYPDYSAVSHVLESVRITPADVPPTFQDYGRGVGLRLKWLELDGRHELYFNTRGYDDQGRRISLEHSSGFVSQETAEVVFAGSFLYAEADPVAAELSALATLDDATLFQLIAEPGDQLVRRMVDSPLPLGEQQIGFTFAYDRPVGSELVGLVTEVRFWQRDTLLAFAWTTRVDNASPPEISLIPLTIELDNRLDAALKGWDNPFVFNASSPAGADRGANQRGA